MKNYRILSLLIIFSLSISSCSRSYYGKSDYQYGPLDNISIAIIPYEVINTGPIPRHLSDEDLQTIENAERKAFQISLHNQILRTLDKQKNYITEIQHYSETNSKLKDAGYDLNQTSDISAKKLGEILEVDAVVKSSVYKEEYFTNLDGFGIQLAADILFVLTDFWWGFDNKTGDVQISSTVLETQMGSVLWSATRSKPTYWYRDASETIEKINHRISKKMPF